MLFFLKKKIPIKIIVSLIFFATLLILVQSVKAISISSGPTSANITVTTADIRWDTDENGDSTVYYTSASPAWQTLASGFPGTYYYSISGLKDDLWTVGWSGVIIHSSNSGATWQSQAVGGVIDGLYDIDMLDSTHGWIAGDSGRILSYNGTNWTSQASGGYGLMGVSALDLSHVWIVGHGGTIRFYNGLGWGTQVSGTMESLLSVYALDASHVWAVGGNGTIKFYNGSSWSTQASGVSVDLNRVYAVDASHVWAVGYNGVILFFNGSNWSTQSSGTGQNLFGLYATDATHVWACGMGGTVLKTNNGVNWQVQTRANIYMDIYAPRNNRAWFVGYINIIDYYGLGTYSFLHDATPTASHNLTLTGLSVGTHYYYYVCSQNSASPPQEVCSNDYEFTTLGVCPDGTYAGQCNASQQYCDPTLTPPQLVYNCTRCSYICPAANIYCNTATGSCQLGCNATTPVGGCFGSQYCASAGNLVNDCRQCSYICPAANIYCDTSDGQCAPGCDVNTPIGGCVGTQYCQSASTLVNDCRQCGYTCPAGSLYCDPANGQCQPGCNATTPVGGCFGTQYCVSAGNLVNDCRQCGYTCPAGSLYCDPANGQCQPGCNATTPVGGCFGTQYCASAGNLVNDCRQCGYTCPPGSLYCDLATGSCQAGCNATTLVGECFGTQYCAAPDTLVNDCRQCGYTCPAANIYCDTSDGQCAPGCDVNTPIGGCVGTQYCQSASTLVNDCRQCGYTCGGATPQCEDSTGQCIADVIPPTISNIQITNITENSAVLSFDTSEDTWGEIEVNINDQCLASVDLIGVFTYQQHYSVFLGGLIPSTDFWLCITVYDASGNANFTGDPSLIHFKTLAEPDLEAPTVSIITPAEGEEISGTYNITVQATDNVGVERVELFFDGEALPFITWTVAPYEYLLDTTTETTGPHTLQAIAYDAAENSTPSATVHFTITNDTAPPVLTEINAEVSDDALNPGKKKAVITWKTDEPADSRVDYTIEEGGSYDHSYGDDKDCVNPSHCVKEVTLTTNHSLELTNLSVNSRYHYRITSCDAKVNCAH